MVTDVKMRGGGHSGVVKDLEKLHKITPHGLESPHVVRKGPRRVLSPDDSFLLVGAAARCRTAC